MKYMLLIYAAEQPLTESDRLANYAESTQLAHQLKANGQYLASNPLQPVATATSVQVKCATASGSSPTAPSPKRANTSAAIS